LVPLVFPAVLLAGEKLNGTEKWHKTFLIFWIVFNVALTVVYGIMHQGGVLPTLFSIQQRIAPEISNPSTDEFVTDIVYYRTYMPPRYLLAIPETEHNKFRIHDLGGKNLTAYMENLTESYKDQSRTGTTETYDKILTTSTRHLIHLVCPYTKQELVASGGTMYENLKLEEEYWPHFGGEHLRIDLTLRWYTLGVP